MSLIDIFTRVAWNDAAQRWYWTAGSGQTGFVAESVIAAELSAHQAAMKVTLQTLTRGLFAGEMNVAEWQVAVAVEIKNASIAQAMFAVGGVDNMTQSDYGRIGQMLREQYGFLDGFGKDIATTGITEQQALVRIGMYGDATEQAYWDAWRANHDTDAALAHLPLLRQSPRDGNTVCVTNCRCYLRTNDDGSVDWVDTGDERECPDCPALAAGGPYRVK